MVIFDSRCSMFDGQHHSDALLEILKLKTIRFAALALGSMLILFAPRAAAVTPATLVDSRLETESIQLATVRDGVVVYFDRDRRLREAPLRDFVQIRAIGKPSPSGTADDTEAARVELVNGQSLPGRWLRSGSDSERFVWEHPRFGRLEIPMEDLSSLTFVGEPISGDDDSADRVRLINGDELTGFVAGVTEQGLSLIPGGVGDPIVLPIDRVAAVRLANPIESVSDADRVTLRDGTVLLARGIVITADEARFDAALPGRPMRELALPLSAVARIELTAGGAQLLDLGSLPREVTGGGEVFGLSMLPRFAPASAQLHAPLTLRFELPPGATRFAVDASLPTGPGAPPRLLDHADLELVFRLDGQTLERRRFNADEPRHTINLALPSPGADADRSLILELDPGADGPVFDRLELSHPVLLVAPVEPTDASRW